MVRWKQSTPYIIGRFDWFQSYFWWMVRWKFCQWREPYCIYCVSILLLVDGALEVEISVLRTF